MANELARYQTESGEIVITQEDIATVLCPNQPVTVKEVRMFVELCKAQGLNPFIKEAYLIKYGDNPATIVTGKDVFTKRAARNPRYRGHEAGITFIGTDGGLHRREGTLLLQGECLVGGWCRVHVEGYDCPIFDEVSLSEYSTGKSNWKKMPATMIRKVALVHALREAFPEDFQGLYDSAEMGDAVPENNEPYSEQGFEPVAEIPVYEQPAEQPAEASAVTVQQIYREPVTGTF